MEFGKNKFLYDASLFIKLVPHTNNGQQWHDTRLGSESENGGRGEGGCLKYGEWGRVGERFNCWYHLLVAFTRRLKHFWIVEDQAEVGAIDVY